MGSQDVPDSQADATRGFSLSGHDREVIPERPSTIWPTNFEVLNDGTIKGRRSVSGPWEVVRQSDFLLYIRWFSCDSMRHIQRRSTVLKLKTSAMVFRICRWLLIVLVNLHRIDCEPTKSFTA
jgi:hypothetical protein